MSNFLLLSSIKQVIFSKARTLSTLFRWRQCTCFLARNEHKPWTHSKPCSSCQVLKTSWSLLWIYSHTLRSTRATNKISYRVVPRVSYISFEIKEAIVGFHWNTCYVNIYARKFIQDFLNLRLKNVNSFSIC